MEDNTNLSSPSRQDGLPPESLAWLEEHQEPNPTAFEEVWHLTAFLQDDVQAAQPSQLHVNYMEAQISAATRQRDRASAQRRHFRLLRRWPALAAAAALVLLLGLGWWLRPVVYTAPAGAMATADLPDGTTVTLNSGSTLSYQRPFSGNTRHVTLEGEAYFDVTQAAAPFVVETFNSAVTVLGTRFNVRAWPDGHTATTEVVLEEGRVQLAAREAVPGSVVLEPGQVSRVIADAPAPTPPAPIAMENKMAWRSGGFRFLDTPLGDVLDELGRRTQTTISVSDPTLRDLHVSVLLTTLESPEAVLAIIAEMRNLHYEPTTNGYQLSRVN